VEFPYIQEIYADLKDQDFTVIALEIRGDHARAKKFMEEKGITFKSIHDKDARVARDLYGVYAYPTSFIIDKEGMIRYRHIGFKPGMEENLRSEIAQVLG